MADVRVASLPTLPIDLPQPDFSDVDAIKVPGIGTIDLRPALKALVHPRTLPDLDLLHVQAAHAEAVRGSGPPTARAISRRSAGSAR